MSAGDLAWAGQELFALPLVVLALAMLLLVLSLFFNPRAQMLAGIFLLFAVANMVGV